VVPADKGKLHETFGGADGEFAKEQSVDEGEDGGVGADS
jgi:hypothetical protein